MNNLTFEELRNANLTRCNGHFHPLEDWTPTDWACAMAGEAGEACNEVKKLRRICAYPEMVDQNHSYEKRKEYRERVEAVAKELADVVIYADLLASRLNISLGIAVREKFNEVSRRVNANVKL